MITIEQLTTLVGKTAANKFHAAIVENCNKYSISSNQRLAYFLAQVLHESARFSIDEESLYYTSLDRIKKVFAGSRSSFIDASLVKNAEKLANTMYGGIWGKKNLGNTMPSDGWKFRGRGAIQTTGRDGYKRASQNIFGDDRLLDNPDLMKEPSVSIAAAAFEFKEKGCNLLADKADFKAVTKKINGGYTGLDDRIAWLKKVNAVLR